MAQGPGQGWAESSVAMRRGGTNERLALGVGTGTKGLCDKLYKLRFIL